MHRMACFEKEPVSLANVFRRNSQKISVGPEQKQNTWFHLKYVVDISVYTFHVTAPIGTLNPPPKNAS